MAIHSSILPWESMSSMKRQKDTTPEDEHSGSESVQNATGESRGEYINSSRKNEVTGAKGGKTLISGYVWWWK